MEEADSLEAAAAARRERLQALRAAQQLLSSPDHQPDGQPPNRHSPTATAEEDDDNDNDNEEDGLVQEQENQVSMKFRNYLPHDKQLQEGKLAPPVLPKFEDPLTAAPPPEEKKEDPFLNIAPKKPNWDLRRDVQKKLDKLEKRTQKAMVKLMGASSCSLAC
ncbi:OLC1v1011951C2 [Oldenlandia corymbosa var. corymbosa]|uniref:OLC1v1011951C2 n=1 Tax=Oldenlandia corymbosa var. corymbosa TaxID=529605 RepID=A0AAV1DX88_OLDCO|nr:OLC1v1011951C2 [Oldenlandia corymbosa var. corymbosa]